MDISMAYFIRELQSELFRLVNILKEVEKKKTKPETVYGVFFNTVWISHVLDS